ncbi:hypothetical protein BN961_03930 [Afipia felis]|uniref:Uncharacterized protein n=1 Tax=Afipia felis TaxID=1035 RepID=A0A090MT15_AFIFE|nr:hypothetical protein BN961_03930 [Afipia felis]
MKIRAVSIAVSAHENFGERIYLTSALEHAPRFVAIWNGNDDKSRTLRTRILKDARGRSIAVLHRCALLTSLFGTSPISLNYNIRSSCLAQRRDDRASDSAGPHDNNVVRLRRGTIFHMQTQQGIEVTTLATSRRGCG